MSNQLTIHDLRAYQAGLLSKAEQHRIERALLEDPFYADVLDGLDALQQAGMSLTEQTAELKEVLHERVHASATKQRLMPLWVASAVASIMLMLAVAIYMIYFYQPPFKAVDPTKPMVFEVELTPVHEQKLPEVYQQEFAAFVKASRRPEVAGAGQVIVTLDVTDRGEISSVTIRKSLDAAHDQEAERLVRAFRKWPSGKQEVQIDFP
ncbi:energy transducer TonB family protein [Arsenicibacter rosenii]|uniref:TonB C-terminal domain-containing protein n=1 Tax=Arsenicibacter rosenii TaxID=1750698 RepID=A0A1S2VMP4_9BACT|nr:energy transducer TonB [Arsenicibacter rosenii]OIN60041.1 hypothetical protein BLX24_04100 [Arsenicibacter rosenii]